MRCQITKRMSGVLFMMFVVQFASAAEVLSRRVAILCEPHDESLLSLVEQAEVQIGQEAGIELLDRANILKVWKEQALSLEHSAIQETAVKVGKILRADVLAVVSMRDDYVAWRIMNTSDGRLLNLQVSKWPSENRSSTLTQMATSIKSGVEKSRAVVNDAHYIAVARFVSRDILRQYDALEEVLPELVAARLSSMPKLVMVERSQLAKIEEESARTDGRKNAYRASAWLVEGVFNSRRDGNGVMVKVALSAGSLAQPNLIHYTCECSASDPAGLAREISEKLVRAIDGNAKLPVAAPLDDEAEALYRKGLFFDSQKAYAASLPIYETACALAPSNSIYHGAAIAARRMVLVGSSDRVYAGPGIKFNLSPEVRMSYYLQEIGEWGSVIRNDLPAAKNMLRNINCVSAPWLDTTHFGAVSFESPLDEEKKEALAAYFSTVDAVVKWHAAHRWPLQKAIIWSLQDTVFEESNSENPSHFCKMLRYLVGLDCSSDQSERILDNLKRLAMRHTVAQQGAPQEALDPFAGAIFAELTQDRRLLIRFLATAALCAPYTREGNWTYRSDTPERTQAAVSQLAFWDEPNLPGVVAHEGMPVYRVLEGALLFKNWRDVRPGIAAIRKALQEPGAAYTAALAALTQQLLLDGGHPAKVRPPYREWSDVLCLHLDYCVKNGQKAFAEQLARLAIIAESGPGQSSESAACVEQVKRCLTAHGIAVPVPEHPQPVIAASPASSTAEPPVQTHQAAWHIDMEKILGHEIGSSSLAVAADGKTAFFIEDTSNCRSLVRKVSVSVIDLRTANVQTNVAVYRGKAEDCFALSAVLSGKMLWLVPDRQKLFANSTMFLYIPGSGILPATPDGGLPVKEMRSLVGINGRYFVGCLGGLGEWSFEQKRFSMIFGNRVSLEGQPLSGGPLYEIADMWTDEPGNRLFLLVREEESAHSGEGAALRLRATQGSRNGVWEYSLTNGTQRQVLPLRHWAEVCYFTKVDETYLYLNNVSYTLIINPRSLGEGIVVAWPDFQSAILQDMPTRDVRRVPGGLFLSPFAARNGDLIYAKEEGSAIYIWPRNSSASQRIRLVDKEGSDLFPPRYAARKVRDFAACQYGVVYRRNDGCVGLLTNLIGEAKR